MLTVFLSSLSAVPIGKKLAIANIVLCVLACSGYAYSRDWRRAVYWGSAAVLTASVTF